jgi:hypothetical protein
MNTKANKMLDPSFRANLTSQDDPALWALIVKTVLADAAHAAADRKVEVFAKIGCCRHWIAPHSARWPAGGSFALPFGYDKTTTKHFYRAVPDLDWSECLTWTGDKWQPGRGSSRSLVLWVAVPARTARHTQAAVHTIWTPRSPAGEDKLVQLYGFRKKDDTWSLAAFDTLRKKRRGRSQVCVVE